MYHIYIIKKCSKGYFIGLTNDIKTKLNEHKLQLISKGKDCDDLQVLFIEYFQDAFRAISKLKELKGLNNRQLESNIIDSSKYADKANIAI